MHLPANLLLTFGLSAAGLFVGVFVAALVITMRNRRAINRYFNGGSLKAP